VRDLATMKHRALLGGFAASIASTAMYGVARFTFNIVSMRVFGAEYVGTTNRGLATLAIGSILVAAPLAGIAGKFVAEIRGRGEGERAALLYGGALLLALPSCVGVSLLALGILPTSGEHLLLPYCTLYGIYLVVRMGYLAHEDFRGYLMAETAGSIAFGATFAAACATHNLALATVSLVVQPAVFLLAAVRHVASTARFRGALRELRTEVVAYVRYGTSTLLNATAGTVNSQLLIALPGYLGVAGATLGHVSVMLSALSPISVFSQAIGAVLFPTMAFRFGANDDGAQRRLVLDATLAMQLIATIAAVALVAGAGQLLALVHVPEDAITRAAWIAFALPACVALVAAPGSTYLSATRYADQQAVVSVGCALLSFGLAMVLLPQWGLLGVAMMSATVGLLGSYVRLVLAGVHVGLDVRASIAVWTPQAALLGGCALAIATTSLAAVTLVLCLALLLQLPHVGRFVPAARWVGRPERRLS